VRNEQLTAAPIAELTDGETVPEDVQLVPVPSAVVEGALDHCSLADLKRFALDLA
jgi:hypothetical protein